MPLLGQACDNTLDMVRDWFLPCCCFLGLVGRHMAFLYHHTHYSLGTRLFYAFSGLTGAFPSPPLLPTLKKNSKPHKTWPSSQTAGGRPSQLRVLRHLSRHASLLLPPSSPFSMYVCLLHTLFGLCITGTWPVSLLARAFPLVMCGQEGRTSDSVREGQGQCTTARHACLSGSSSGGSCAVSAAISCPAA